jgi:hypothetical protein
VSQQSTNRSFDDLARALAEGSISRRRALKLFAGTALAALIPSRALAEDDEECVRICHVPRTSTGECDFANAQTRCVSRRERRRHLENHPCDCRGRCANCLTSTTTSTTSTSTSTSTSTTSTTPSCLPFGGRCTADTQCCSGICDSRLGECRNCRVPGSSCTSDAESQCCSGICDTDGTCCIVDTGCFTNDDCCSGLSCVDGRCVR